MQIQLEQFEGPLDLLLQLIEEQELDITTVSLAKVTDQYLRSLEEIENIIPEEVADFLVVASKLIYLKSKYLLPALDLQAEDSAEDLEKQLKIYQKFYQASKVIGQLIGKRHFSFVRNEPLKLPKRQRFSPPVNLKAMDLAGAMQAVIARLTEIKNLPHVMMIKAVSIKERISEFQQLLSNKAEMVFSHFIKPENKVDTIVSFLALLELVKQRVINVHQSDMFA